MRACFRSNRISLYIYSYTKGNHVYIITASSSHYQARNVTHSHVLGVSIVLLVYHWVLTSLHLFPFSKSGTDRLLTTPLPVLIPRMTFFCKKHLSSSFTYTFYCQREKCTQDTPLDTHAHLHSLHNHPTQSTRRTMATNVRPV